MLPLSSSHSIKLLASSARQFRSALRFLIAFAVTHGCTITTLDVADACLFAKLGSDDKIYLRVPPRMHDVADFLDEDGNPAEFIKLTQYLYGLHRAGAAFYRYFRDCSTTVTSFLHSTFGKVPLLHIERTVPAFLATLPLEEWGG